MEKKELIDSLKDGLIVSCQAVPSEPHYMPGITTMYAECAKWAGAVGLRVNSPDDIRGHQGEGRPANYWHLEN